MTGLKLRRVMMVGAIALSFAAFTPQKSEAGWGYGFYRAPVRAYRPAVRYRPVVPVAVVPRAVYRPIAPVAVVPHYSGYRGYSPYYSGYRGYSPYTSGYRGVGVSVGFGIAPVGYIGY